MTCKLLLSLHRTASKPLSSLEQLISNLETLQAEGHYKTIGLSEVNAQTLRSAHALTPIVAVEIELSLMSLEPAVLDVVKACEELSVACVAYSPLGRGLLTGKWKKVEDLDSPIAKMQPRFADGNFQENVKLLNKIEELAGRIGCTASQFALAYLLQLSDQVSISPVQVGTRLCR
jgi:pyridoxine 4-dehydrogenase